MAQFSRRAALFGIAALAAGKNASAQTPEMQTPQNPAASAEPGKPTYKAVPPPGIVISDADRKELAGGVAALDKILADLQAALPKTHPALLRYLPDAQIFRNSVYYALTYDEFFSVKEVETARDFLKQGRSRAEQLQNGNAPWINETGLQVFGYVSQIDKSIQPYGILVPPEWKAGDGEKRRLDFFLHGRGDTLNEIAFIAGRQKSRGEFSPPNTFVLQPYGRFCNANRYAGEVDLLEALADAKSRYAIDSDRIIVRGFSMGGAACWQFATHYADKWAAAAPGAGFTDTATYTNAFAPGKPKPTEWEQKLWAWYDPVDYAANLAQVPVVACSGQVDKQKQAADNMVEAAKKEGITFPYVIGKDAGHKYTPDAKAEINALLDTYAKKGRQIPKQINFTTYTLRYNKMFWLTVEGLEKHWERARVKGGVSDDNKTLSLTTENVSRLRLDPAFAPAQTIILDKQIVSKNGAKAGLFEKLGGQWLPVAYAPEAEGEVLEKRPGLQGPIDDAFCAPFLMVRGTGTPLNPQVEAWTTGEMAHALREYRKMFRAEARVMNDTKVTDADMRRHHLILWGDPRSNAVLAKIADKLPVTWDANGVHVRDKTYPVETTVPVLVFPNLLAPSRYVVINSGHTFREGHYSSNALQTPKLPDWAIVDITTPPTAFAPGRIADAGFFDEEWQL